MASKGLIITGVVLVGLAGLGVWRGVEATKRSQSAADQVESSSMRVGVAKAERGTLRETVIVSGVLRPLNEVDVVADVPGRVVSLSGEIGQTVHAGQVLARLEADELSAGLAQAKGAVAAATAGRDAAVRQRDAMARLAEAGGVGDVQIAGLKDQAAGAEAQLQQALAGLALAESRLADATIKSPITGTITDRTTGMGRMVGPGAPLFHVMDLSVLEMEILVDERVAPLVRAGMPVEVQTTAGGVSATGTVRVSSPALDPRTHKAKVIVSVPAEGLVPYATASARLVLDAKEGLIIPRRAVMATDAGDSVFAVRDNAAHRLPVTLGVAEGDRIQVDGVNDGDAIVIEGLDQISDGSAVEVAPEAK